MLAERIEVWIDLQVGEVVIPEQDCPGECVDRLVGSPGTCQRAGEIVAGEEVVGQHFHQPEIEFERPSHKPLLRDKLRQNAEDLHRLSVTGKQPLEKVDVEVELAQIAEPILVGVRWMAATGVAAHGAARVGIVGRDLAAGHRECS